MWEVGPDLCVITKSLSPNHVLQVSDNWGGALLPTIIER